MCEPDTIRYTGGASFTVSDKAAAQAYVKGCYETAVELFAYLCDLYDLDPLKDGVIISHAEGYKRGIASGHADPEHLWKGLGMGYTMDGFRKAVKAKMGGTATEPDKPAKKQLYRVRKAWADAKSQIGAFEVLENAKAACKTGYKVFDSNGKVVFTPFTPYTFRTTCDVLNIRSGPGTNYPVIGQIKDKKRYTIVKEKTGPGSAKGWGRIGLRRRKRTYRYGNPRISIVLNGWFGDFLFCADIFRHECDGMPRFIHTKKFHMVVYGKQSVRR